MKSVTDLLGDLLPDYDGEVVNDVLVTDAQTYKKLRAVVIDFSVTLEFLHAPREVNIDRAYVAGQALTRARRALEGAGI